MDEAVLQALVATAQQGDAIARENLIEQCLPFVKSTASKVCKRPVAWENDDELSVALVAFNEAIDRYKRDKGANFFTFAHTVICQRLIDYFRKENRHQHLSWDFAVASDNVAFRPLEIEKSLEQHQVEQEQQALALMMAEFEQRLNEYGTSFEQLVAASPKHRDTRERLVGVAQQLVSNPELYEVFQRTKRLPAKELLELTRVSRRVLENGRTYIVALSIILGEPEFAAIKSFIDAT